MLAVHLRRSAFDTVLAEAVHSTYDASHYENEETWDNAVARSNVRLQWDPDHDPSGTPLPRRVIQLGLRGNVLVKFAREWIIGIEDISDFVQTTTARHQQRLFQATRPHGRSLRREG